MKQLSAVLATLGLYLASSPVFSVTTPPRQLPEPGMLELLSIGAVVAVAIAIRNRRK